MRQTLVAMTLASVLLCGWVLPAGAQQNGIVIQNNGVDSSDSAAGSDNVQISNNPGAAQGSTAGGVNNETARVAREPRERDRSNRGARNNVEGGGEAAPMEAAAAPAEEDLQAFSDAGEYVDPVAAPVEVAQPAKAEPVALQLPNTGIGTVQTLPLAALAFLGAILAGFAALRQRFIG